MKIRMESESGKVFEVFPVNLSYLIDFFWQTQKNNLSEYPWFSSIDPYGDTLFNVHQAPYVVVELKKFKHASKNEIQERKEVTHEDIDQYIDGVITILGKIKQHEYIRFIGD